MIAPSDSDSILEITSRMPRCHLTWSDANSIRGVVLPSRGIVWGVRATSNEAKVETVSSSSLVVAASVSLLQPEARKRADNIANRVAPHKVGRQ